MNIRGIFAIYVFEMSRTLEHCQVASPVVVILYFIVFTQQLDRDDINGLVIPLF